MMGNLLLILRVLTLISTFTVLSTIMNLTIYTKSLAEETTECRENENSGNPCFGIWSK